MPLGIRVFWFGECWRLDRAQGGSTREGSCNEAATARHGECSGAVACEKPQGLNSATQYVRFNDQLAGTFMWPPPWITRIVNGGQNVNQVILDRVKNAIRETWQECSAYARDNFSVQKRNLLKALKLKFKSQLKFGAKTFALFLIPIERFTNFASGTTGKLQAVRYEPLFKCAFT